MNNRIETQPSPYPVTLDEIRYLLEALDTHRKKITGKLGNISVNDFNKCVRQGEELLVQCQKLISRLVERTDVVKKNPDFQKTYDGPNQSARNLTTLAGMQFNYPNMEMTTHTELIKSFHKHLETMYGESKMILVLNDTVRVLEALNVLFEFNPIAEVVNGIYDLAYESSSEAKEATDDKS